MCEIMEKIKEEGAGEKLLALVVGYMKACSCTVEQACDAMFLSEEDRERCIAMLGEK